MQRDAGFGVNANKRFHVVADARSGGPTWIDMLGERSGTLAGWSTNPTWIPSPGSPYGLGLDFGNSGGRTVSFGSQQLFPTGSDWTAAAWVYRNSGAGDGGIFSQRNAYASGSNAFSIGTGNGNSFNINKNNTFVNLSVSLPTGEWCYVAVTGTAAQVAGYVFRVGVPVASSSSSGDWTAASVSSGANLQVGGLINEATYYLKGQVGSVEAWSRALSASELQWAFDDSLTRAQESIARAWRRREFFWLPEPGLAESSRTAIADDTFAGTPSADLTTYLGTYEVRYYRNATASVGGNTIIFSAAGKARTSSTGEAWYTASGLPPSADQDADAYLDVKTVTSGFTGVVARASTTEKTGYAAVILSGSLQLYRIVAATATQLGSSVSLSLSPGDTPLLRLRCQGSAITVFLNGVSQIAVTGETAISEAGRCGIYFSGATTDSTGIHVTRFAAGPVDIGASTAAIATSISLGSAVAAQGGASAALSSAIALGSALAAQGGATAVVSTSVVLGSTLAAQGGSAAAMATSITLGATLAATASAAATATADIATSIALGSTLAAQGGGSAALASALSLGSTLAAQGGGSAALSTSIVLGSTLAATATGAGASTAAIATSVVLGSTLAAQAGASAAIASALALGSSLAAKGGASSSLSTSVVLGSTLAATAVGLDEATAIVSTSISLGATLAATGVPSAVADTLLEAILTRLEAEVGGSIAGGFWTDVAPRGTAMPYVRVTEVGETDEDESATDSGRSRFERTEYQVSVFGSGKASTRALGKLVSAAIDLVPLAFSEGVLLHIAKTGRAGPELDPERSPTGGPVWHEAIVFEATIERPL